MANKAREQTDKRLEEMEKKLFQIYSRAEKEIGNAWRDYLNKIDLEIGDVQKKYDDAKKNGDKDEIKKIGKELAKTKKEKTILNKHYKNLTEKVANEISKVNQTAIKYINDNLADIYAWNYNDIEADIKSAELDGYSFEIVDSNTIKNLAVKNETLLPFKEIGDKKDVRWNTQKVNSEVLQGILQGESMQKIADRLQKVTEMNKNHAITNARTTVTSAENKGRFDSYLQAEKDGLILDKEWIATNDGRTRHSHAILDGEIVKTDDNFSNGLRYPADPNGNPSEVYNCRCTMAAVFVGVK